MLTTTIGAPIPPSFDVTVSVIVCTHNPRQDYLTQTLEGLRRQSLATDQWELLIVDNACTPPLAVDLTWHPRGRLLREETIGLTQARICGIEQASADLLVFVDDDNVLNPEYLATALKISREWPILGVWGSQGWPEFERTPPDFAREYWMPRELGDARWSNLPEVSQATPSGNGMCVRRPVAEAYARKVRNDPARRRMDRTGTQLFSGGDHDLCLTACDLGLGHGIFSELRLTHLIPARRLEEDYMLKLVEGNAYSNLLLKYFRGESPMRPSRSQRLLRWYESLRLPARLRRLEAAKRRGIEAGVQEIERLERERALISDPA